MLTRNSLSALLCAALLAACGDSPTQPGHGVDLDRLFAPPTATEIAAVEADWASRQPAARDVRIEYVALSQLVGLRTMQLRVISHVVDGNRHYGAVLTPDSSAPGLPLMLYLHGGDDGVSVNELNLIALSAGIDPTRYVWLVPSFRSERLETAGRSWTSQGEPSPWDRDVDDTLGLIASAAQLFPLANARCIGALGVSRGAGVALLLSARDQRLRSTVAFFGPTDFFGPFVRDVADEALRGQMRDLPGLTSLNAQWLQPLRAGQTTYADVRLALLRRSAAWFVQRMGAVQLHHGTADDVVPVSQAHALIAAMEGIGRVPPAFEGYIYEGAGHNPLTMPGSAPRTAAYLGALPTRCARGAQ
jgi:dipeptidyl aminopeptidase/acylaminoacyl peptidase